jgi:sulfatase modifying factor 1
MRHGLKILVLCVVAAVTVEGTGQSQVMCPDDMVHATPTVCIDRYDWPNVEGVRPQLGLSAVPEDEDIENGVVMDAEALCESVGKRVCTAQEWEQACRGPDQARYPWGDELPKYVPGTGEGICNYDKWFKPYDEEKVFERDPKHMAELDQSEPAGSRPKCVAPSGAYDMIGNGEQWVRCPKKGRYGWCLVGRFWSEPVSCSARITAHAPKWHWYTTTTRCCLDVE